MGDQLVVTGLAAGPAEGLTWISFLQGIWIRSRTWAIFEPDSGKLRAIAGIRPGPNGYRLEPFLGETAQDLIDLLAAIQEHSPNIRVAFEGIDDPALQEILQPVGLRHTETLERMILDI